MPWNDKTEEILARPFAFLGTLGFHAVGGTFARLGSVIYASDVVLVVVSWDWRDEIADIALVRRTTSDPFEEPYWAHVHLDEILEHRLPDDRSWSTERSNVSQRELTNALDVGAGLLRDHAEDLLRGEHLELLDEIVAARQRRGVPGLDFPADKPWAVSREGMWTFTDSQMPRDVATYLAQSRSEQPTDRVVAALKLPVGMRGTRDKDALLAARVRLRELLDDPDSNVRSAAASSLGVIADTESLDEFLGLLDLEDGHESSAFAAAATFVAFDAPTGVRRRVLEYLHAFSAKGPRAQAQVAELAWRLGEGNPPELEGNDRPFPLEDGDVR